MPKYSCPECDTELRTKAEVPPGKKLRCPECDTVFAPKRAKAAAAPAPAKPKHGSGGDSGAQYALKEEETASTDNEEVRRAIFDPVKDRFKKSARGPAMGMVVRPSDWLLRTGMLCCLSAIVGIAIQIWPMIFRIEKTQPPPKPGQPIYSNKKTEYIELTAEEYKTAFVWIGIYTLQFAWGAGIVTGAAKMHNLEWYPMAMAASCMAMLGPFLPWGIQLLMDTLNGAEADPYWIFLSILLMAIPGVPMSIWCIVTLRKEAVRAGFAEVPDYD